MQVVAAAAQESTACSAGTAVAATVAVAGTAWFELGITLAWLLASGLAAVPFEVGVAAEPSFVVAGEESSITAVTA